jgi:hypothetical protein
MKRYTNIDYSQQPASYWEDPNPLDSILRNVKGRQRRQMITDYWNAGRLDELDDELLKDTVNTDLRDRLGRIHPSFMGGEYLPDYGQSEVEIARLELQSATSDVISIRARRTSKTIRYRIVDEYNTDFNLPRKSSQEPLTLAELIAFFDGTSIDQAGSGLATIFNDLSSDIPACRPSVRHFTRVTSSLYPQLEEHYEHVYDDWVEQGN